MPIELRSHSIADVNFGRCVVLSSLRKYSPEGDSFYDVLNPSIRGNRFGIFSGGLRPTLFGDKINLNQVIRAHGDLKSYFVSRGIIRRRDSTNVIGVLFSGGPAPSGNAVIREIVIGAYDHGMQVIGFEDGCKGLLSGKGVVLTRNNVWGIHREGDVLIGTTRNNPDAEQIAKIKTCLRRWGITSLTLIGGDDTQTTATRLTQAGILAVGVPKTIDNDLPETDITFGHETVVNATAHVVYNLILAGRSSNAWYIGQFMGRKSGSITLRTALAAGVTRTFIGEEYSRKGILELANASRQNPVLKEVLRDIADVVEIEGKKMSSPEELVRAVSQLGNDRALTIDIDALTLKLKELIESRAKKDLLYGFIAIAEGLIDKLPIKILEYDEKGRPKRGIIESINEEISYDEFGNPRLSGINLAGHLTRKLKKLTGATIIDRTPGYEFRCETDVLAYDINLSTRFGHEAINLVRRGEFGRMVRIRNDEVSSIPFEKLPIDPETGHIIPRSVGLDSDLYLTAKKIERYKESPKLRF
jgi:6-phosphofructokinase